MRVGLKIDVDTLRGTMRGVPALVRELDRLGIRATFFLSVGPDNMGRHLWRLVRPAFLAKMVRTRAPGLYGWSILLRGTIVPGPRIGARAAEPIRALARSGHEIGLHAWDHHAWQTRIGRMDADEVGEHLRRAQDLLTELTGSPPACSAAPAWRITSTALVVKTRFPFDYNADTRGKRPFFPLLDGESLGQLQIPTTLPTYDERVRPGVSPRDYFDEVLARVEEDPFSVLTIHAEVEGIAARQPFVEFLERALAAGHRFVPLAELAADAAADAPAARVARVEIPGREGWVSAA